MADKKSHPNLIIELAGLLTVLFSAAACVPIYRMTGIPLNAHCIGAGVTSVSAAPNSDKFAISYCDEKKSLIAVGYYASGQMKIVLNSNDSLFLRPVFLHKDGDIAFIERSTVDLSKIKTIHEDGSTTELTSERPESKNIRDMTPSSDGRTIYYINSQRYSRSSPVGPYLPHDNDFYALSVNDRLVKRLSFSSEYHLSGVSVSRDGETIFSRSAVLESDGSKIKAIRYLVAKDLLFTEDHLTYTSEIPLSEVSSRKQMILACGKATKFFLGDPVVEGYGLFLIQLPERKIVKELIHLRSYLTSPTILEKKGVVLFIRQPFEKPLFRKLKRELWSVNLDGSNLKRIPLPEIE
jgi:hypothetical protein